MPKYKDFFTKLKTQGKISIPDYDKFLETAPDAEIPDSIVNAIEANFMTIERASVHPEIHKKIKREVLDPLDTELGEIAEVLKGYVDEGKLKADPTNPNTYKLFRTLKESLPDVIKKAKGNPVTDEETKRKLADQERINQELVEKFTTAEKDYNTKLKNTDDTWGGKFEELRLSTELEKRGNKYILAEAFETTRPAITKVILTELRQGNQLKLGENNGQPVIVVNDEHGKPKFNGNSPVTIESLLDEAYKPFLKKSETTQTQVNPKTQTKVDPTKPTIRQGTSTTVTMRK